MVVNKNRMQIWVDTGILYDQNPPRDTVLSLEE
jgi:hypothetical protein